MIQAPNLVNPYMQPQMMPAYACQQPVPAPNYNAVKIDVHNPAVSAPGVGQVAMNVPQYAQPTMPYYSYPQTQLYSYPQAQTQPYYMPAQQPVVQQAPAAAEPAVWCCPRRQGGRWPPYARRRNAGPGRR